MKGLRMNEWMNENVYSLKFVTFVNEKNCDVICYVHEMSYVYYK